MQSFQHEQWLDKLIINDTQTVSFYKYDSDLGANVVIVPCRTLAASGVNLYKAFRVILTEASWIML